MYVHSAKYELTRTERRALPCRVRVIVNICLPLVVEAVHAERLRDWTFFHAMASQENLLTDNNKRGRACARLQCVYCHLSGFKRSPYCLVFRDPCAELCKSQ